MCGVWVLTDALVSKTWHKLPIFSPLNILPASLAFSFVFSFVSNSKWVFQLGKVTNIQNDILSLYFLASKWNPDEWGRTTYANPVGIIPCLSSRQTMPSWSASKQWGVESTYWTISSPLLPRLKLIPQHKQLISWTLKLYLDWYFIFNFLYMQTLYKIQEIQY